MTLYTLLQLYYKSEAKPWIIMSQLRQTYTALSVELLDNIHEYLWSVKQLAQKHKYVVKSLKPTVELLYSYKMTYHFNHL